jgi:hypothetical protein
MLIALSQQQCSCQRTSKLRLYLHLPFSCFITIVYNRACSEPTCRLKIPPHTYTTHELYSILKSGHDTNAVHWLPRSFASSVTLEQNVMNFDTSDVPILPTVWFRIYRHVLLHSQFNTKMIVFSIGCLLCHSSYLWKSLPPQESAKSR